ncbi:unnamed protein product [Orchesella dallaii]|uniref:Uncharacterized protein n=1 Tax=Orchesella dallaii TaxID=48710 RepID=A0ABP1QDS0_9HEXA
MDIFVGGGGLPYVGRWGFSDFLRKWEFHVAVEPRYYPRLSPSNTQDLHRNRNISHSSDSNSKQIDTFECILLLSTSFRGDNKTRGRSHRRLPTFYTRQYPNSTAASSLEVLQQLQYHYHHHHKKRDWHNREEITFPKFLPQPSLRLGGEQDRNGSSRLVSKTSSDLQNNNGLIWNGLVAQDALRNTLQWQ